MIEQEYKKNVSRAVPFFIGAVVGTAAGLLLAPKAGKETREQLESWLKAKREDVKHEWQVRRERHTGKRPYEEKEPMVVA